MATAASQTMSTIRTDFTGLDAYSAALGVSAAADAPKAPGAEQPFADFSAFAGSDLRFGAGQGGGAADAAGVARQVLGLIAEA